MTGVAREVELAAEWLEADGLGGFASGTVGGVRTRRYHALLLAATTPPTGRVVLVNGLEVELVTAAGRYALSAQRYTPDVTHPDGQARLIDFKAEPWPRWTFRAEDGTFVTHEIVARHGHPEVALRWQLQNASGGAGARLIVRPLLSGRDYHGLHHENGGFNFEPEIAAARVTWQPYPGLPPVTVLCNGAYRHEPAWYRNFQYDAERDRGLDFVEDLAAPGWFELPLDGADAVMALCAGEAEPMAAADPGRHVRRLFAAEREASLLRDIERRLAELAGEIDARQDDGVDSAARYFVKVELAYCRFLLARSLPREQRREAFEGRLREPRPRVPRCRRAGLPSGQRVLRAPAHQRSGRMEPRGARTLRT